MGRLLLGQCLLRLLSRGRLRAVGTIFGYRTQRGGDGRSNARRRRRAGLSIGQTVGQ